LRARISFGSTCASLVFESFLQATEQAELERPTVRAAFARQPAVVEQAMRTLDVELERFCRGQCTPLGARLPLDVELELFDAFAQPAALTDEARHVVGAGAREDCGECVFVEGRFGQGQGSLRPDVATAQRRAAVARRRFTWPLPDELRNRRSASASSWQLLPGVESTQHGERDARA